jgi:hypothetical protein
MTRYGETDDETRGSVGGSARGGYGGSDGGVMAGGWATLLCGMAAGAALMYFLDPDRGRRRRALLRDQAVGLSNDLGDAATGTARDLRNRAQGLVAEAGSALGVTGGGGEQPGTEEGARRRSATA